MLVIVLMLGSVDFDHEQEHECKIDILHLHFAPVQSKVSARHAAARVVEGDKERIQIFSGIVIGRKGRGLNETFTVRRISYGEGVERVFPLHSPRIAEIKVEKQGRVRRARLNYLRTRKGKEATAVRE